MNLQFSDILPVFQTVILLGGFIIGIRQIILMTNQMRNQVDWQKKNVTFEYLNLYITQFKDLNTSLQKKINLLKQNGRSTNSETLIEELKDKNTRSQIFHLVSYFENLAIGITHHYFDESIAKALLFNIVISTFKSLKPYLLVRRDETSLMVGSNFEKLANKWSNE